MSNSGAHAQGLLNGLAQSRHLACDLGVQSPHDGALALDHLAHAFELAGMGVAPGLVAQRLALFGVGLFELDALGLSRFNQFDASGLEQFAVGGVGDGFLLSGGVHNDAAEFSAGNQFQGDRHFNGAGQELFHAFFAQQFAELDQLGWVARPTVLKVLVARKVLPSRRLAPALNEVFVAFVEGVFEVEQRDHQAGGQARASGFGDASTGHHFGRTKQVRVFDLLAKACGWTKRPMDDAGRSFDRGGCERNRR